MQLVNAQTERQNASCHIKQLRLDPIETLLVDIRGGPVHPFPKSHSSYWVSDFIQASLHVSYFYEVDHSGPPHSSLIGQVTHPEKTVTGVAGVTPLRQPQSLHVFPVLLVLPPGQHPLVVLQGLDHVVV